MKVTDVTSIIARNSRALLRVVAITMASVGALCSYAANSPQVEKALLRVDSAIANAKTYEDARFDEISLLRSRRNATHPLTPARFAANYELVNSFESLMCDSALRYIDENIAIGEHLSNAEMISRSKITKAHIMAKGGLFNEAYHLLKDVDPSTLDNELKAEYYLCFNDLYQFLIEYEGDGTFSHRYRQMTEAYKDSILTYVPADSFDEITMRGSRLMDRRQYNEGIHYLTPYLNRYLRGTREYSIICSIIAFGHRMLGNHDDELIFYSEAAVSDIQGVVKENMAMRALAETTFADGDIVRANSYLNKSLDDANFYSARMRKNQSAHLTPLLSQSMHMMRERQQHTTVMFLVVTALLALCMLVACVFALIQLKRVRESNRIANETRQKLYNLNETLALTNEALASSNSQLGEANAIKEEYISRFLQLCSDNISTLEQYRRMLVQTAASGKADDLQSMLKSHKIVTDTLADFYSAFDAAFLKIFPTFVSRYNELSGGQPLTSDSGVEDKLNTEMRVFALIRIGISDSARIAGLLRCSITTIYTYRSKLKARSPLGAEFEAAIMSIPSLGSEGI